MIWKTIQNYPNYKINEYGVVVNEKNEVIKPVINKSGFYYIGLTKDREQRRFNLAKLVYNTFVDPYLDERYVLHKDGNKSNNHYTNVLPVCGHELNFKNKKHKYPIYAVNRIKNGKTTTTYKLCLFRDGVEKTLKSSVNKEKLIEYYLKYIEKEKLFTGNLNL